MIRTVLLASLLAFIGTILETTLLGAVAIAGAVPDLSLIIVAWVSYANARGEGPATACVSGFAADFLSSGPLGFGAFVATFTSTLISLLHGKIHLDKVILPFFLGFLSVLAKNVGALVLALIFGPERILSLSFAEPRIWIEALYTGIATPPLFLLLGLAEPLLVTERRRR